MPLSKLVDSLLKLLCGRMVHGLLVGRFQSNAKDAPGSALAGFLLSARQNREKVCGMCVLRAIPLYQSREITFASVSSIDRL